MSIASSLLPEFDHEMAGVRRTLERIPGDKLDWRAHPKSNTMGWVGSHLAEIPGWVEGAMTQTSWDIAPPGEEPYQTPMLNAQEMVEAFDKNVAAGRKAIQDAPDDAFFEEWSLLQGGNVLFTMPRIGVLRTFVLNHSIHHRAILTVYLRLNDIPVPALYGPSGDEVGD